MLRATESQMFVEWLEVFLAEETFSSIWCGIQL
jgi:hypothetical protein